MNRKLSGLLLCASLVGIAGSAVRTNAAVVPQHNVAMFDGTAPVQPPTIPPKAAAMFDGTAPVPPPTIPPKAIAMFDGTAPVPPPTIPPSAA